MIRFFISSTFKDMHDERDAIHKRVYPEIRQYGLEKGVSVDICGLRWGIDRDLNQSKDDSITEIMKVCFTEIEDCKPFIVAIIGNKYGTAAPNVDKMIDLWRLMGRKDNELPDDINNISLTQWELEYAFLTKANPDIRSLCLFKKDNSNECEDGAKRLKKKIKGKSLHHKDAITCLDYNGLNEFEKAFIDYAKERIDEEAITGKASDWISKELRYFGAFSKEKSLEFAGRHEYVNDFISFVQSTDKTVLAIYGKSGIGKSSLIAHLFQTTDSSFKKEIVLCGTSQKSSNYLSVLTEIISILEHGLLSKNRNYSFYSEELAEGYLESVLKSLHGSDALLLIFVDAMDKLQVIGKNNLVRIFDKFSPDGIKLVCSQISDYDTTDLHRVRKKELVDLNLEDIREILNHKLFDVHQDSKHIDNPLIKAIADKKDANSPLYIKIVVNILKMHLSDNTSESKNSDHEHINSKTDKRTALYLELIDSMPENTNDICWFAFEEAMSFLFDKNEIDKRIIMEKAIGLIAVSNYGLKDDDLENALNHKSWSSLDFSTLRMFLSDFFIYGYDGGWRLAHDILRKSVLLHFASSDFGETALKRLLFDYVFSDQCISPLEMRIKEGLYLSFLFDELDKTIEVFKVLGGYPADYVFDKNDLSNEDVGRYPAMPIREIASKELDRIMALDKDQTWFRRIISKDNIAVMAALSCILELRGSNDYSRRIPAMHATEKFWGILSVNNRNDLYQWEKDRSYIERLHMAFLCSEFLGVYTDYGDRIYAAVFSYYPLDFYKDRSNFGRMSNEQQKRAFRHMNILFNSNNTVLSYLNSYSNDLMELMEKLPNGIKTDQDCIRAYDIFVNSEMQYYSAIGNLDKSIPNRISILGDAIKQFFIIVGTEYEQYESAFSKLYWIRMKRMDIKKFDFSTHLEIWKKIFKKLGAENYEPDKLIELHRRLNAVASGYFAVCYDMEKVSITTNDYSEYSKQGLYCCEVALFMYSSRFIGNKKETLSCYIRRLRLYRNMKQTLSRDDMIMVSNLCQQAVNEYMEQYRILGFSTGKLLVDTIALYHEDADNVLSETENHSLIEVEDRLRQVIYEVL